MRIVHKNCGRAVSICWQHSIILMTNSFRLDGEIFRTGPADAYNSEDFAIKKLEKQVLEKFAFCPNCSISVDNFSELYAECGCCGKSLQISAIFTTPLITSICSNCISKLKELAEEHSKKGRSMESISELMSKNIFYRIIATYGTKNIVTMNPSKTMLEMFTKLLKS